MATLAAAELAGYCYAVTMVTGEIEHAYVCPHCWERSTLLVDLSISSKQIFVQDCEVCCTPIEFTVAVDNGEIRSFSTQAAND